MRLVKLAAPYLPTALPLSGVFLAVLMLFIAAPPSSAQTTIVPDCGYLNGRPCTPFDNEAYNIYFGYSTQCDFGLYVNIHNKCVPTALSRDTISKKPRTWAQWALSEQRDRVGANVPINMATTFGTHNSYSSYDSGFHSLFSTDQKLSLYDQLEAGARWVRIDAVNYLNNMRVCHMSPLGSNDGTVAGLCAALSPLFSLPFDQTPGRLYAYTIRELADWLDRNTNELVILNIRNDYSPNPLSPFMEENSMLVAPVLSFIGRNRILTPDDLGKGASATGMLWPTINNVRVTRQKQVVILASREFVDLGGRPLAFHFGRDGTRDDNFGRELYLADFNYPTCVNNSSDPYWSKGIAGSFYIAGEDRSGSVSASPPVEYLNAPETRKAARCGVSVINVDYLLHQELSILPVSGPKPDQGPDLRREAAIWSFDENDYGDRGAAYMKDNARWSSDPLSYNHHYACADRNWSYPRNQGGAGKVGKVKITTITGPWHGGPAACSGEFGADFVFYAPGTGPENELLKLEYDKINPTTGQRYGNGGVWLNYISTFGNLLSLATKEVSFSVEYPNGTDVPQAVNITGPPFASVPTPAIVALGASDVFINNPGGLSFDSNGRAIINVSLRSNAATNKAPGLYANRIIYNFVSPNSTPGDSNNSLISQAILNVTLFVKARNQFSLGVNGCSGTVCNFQELQPVLLSMLMVRPKPGTFPITGFAEIREQQTSADGAPFVKTLSPTFALTPGPNVGGYLTGTATSGLTLPPGSHQVAAFFLGGQFDEAVDSNAVTIKVAPFLNPQPTAITQRLNPRSTIPATAGAITINNPANLPISVSVNCGTRVSSCWLQGTGAGNKITLTYAPSVANLVPGVYNAQIEISDGLHARPVVTFALSVVGTLTLTPQQVNITTTPNQPAPVVFTAQVDGADVPLSMAPNAAWLSLQGTQVIANPSGLTVGSFTGQVFVSSPLAEHEEKLTVTMQVVPGATVGSNRQGVPFKVDGTTYSSTQTFGWIPGTTHTISVSALANTPGGNFLFNAWSDNGAATHSVTAGNTAQSYVASFDPAYPVTAAVSPVGSGSVILNPPPTEGAYYRSGASVMVSASPGTGYVFTGFRGDVAGITNPQPLTVNGPKTLVAQFASGAPTLVAIPGPTSASGNTVTVAIQLMNRGVVAATGARILSITGVRVLSGTGTVTPLLQTVDVGNIAPGASATGSVKFDWPSTATRIQFTVNFGDSSGYRGSTTLSLFR